MRIRSAVLTSERALGFQTRFVSVVRYNPVACDAPAWELRRREGWQRVDLIAARDASAEVPMILSGTEVEPGAQLMGLLEWTGRYTTSDGWNHAIVEAQNLSLRPGARSAWP